jgi:hypothetical protein
MTTPLDIALGYIERGWNPVPIPHGAKGPLRSGWQTRIIDAVTAPQYFNGSPMNVGVLLGPSSHGLTDVDLDCAEAIVVAPYILPPTKAIFGRPSKPGSHRLYVTNLATISETATIAFRDPTNKQTILELRIGGDKGAQTVFPGSTHPSGEAISWEERGEPASIKDYVLRQRVRATAAYALLARHWPGEGGRHEAARIVGGFLARAGRTPSRAGNAVEAIARAAADPQWQDRKTAARDAAAAHQAGKHTYGAPALKDMFSKNVAEKVVEWLDYKGGDDQPPINCTLKSARASTFELCAVQWLWPNRFALGKLGIIAGLPDEGKGQIFADMAARVTRGREWPCGEGVAPQGNVILLTAEDGISDTVAPRHEAAGADRSRIEIISMVRQNDKDRMFSLLTDLDLLRKKVIEVGNVKLIQIDPISAYLGVGKIDTFRTTDVRAVLSPLVDLAGELMTCVVGIMHFNKKVDVTNALLRISDSLAFGATARHVYAVVDDAENKRKLFVKGKNNLAAADTKALAYGFGLREVGRDRKTGEVIRAPHIVWHSQHVDVTATEAMQAATEAKSPAARDSAKKFLTELLADGPVAKKDIEDAAEGNGISERTLFRAKAELGVVAKKDGPGGSWTWRLPPVVPAGTDL